MSKVPKKEKEVVVRTPFLISKWYESPEVRAIAERLNFFAICRKIGKFSAWPIMVVSLSLFLFTAYGILYSTQFSFPKPLLIDAIFSIGLMNIFSGLLLLAKE